MKNKIVVLLFPRLFCTVCENRIKMVMKNDMERESQ